MHLHHPYPIYIYIHTQFDYSVLSRSSSHTQCKTFCHSYHSFLLVSVPASWGASQTRFSFAQTGINHTLRTRDCNAQVSIVLLSDRTFGSFSHFARIRNASVWNWGNGLKRFRIWVSLPWINLVKSGLILSTEFTEILLF